MNIPQSWKDIKLPQFEAAMKVAQAHYDDEIYRQVDWIAALTGSTVDEVLELPLAELTSIARQLQWVKDAKFNEKIPKFFTAGGKLWEVVYEVNKLNPIQRNELLEWGQNDPMANLDKAMASITIERKWVLLKGKYDSSTHSERAAIFRKDLSLAVIYPIAQFFNKVFSQFLLVVADHSAKQLHELNRDLMKELKQILKEQRIEESEPGRASST